MKEELIGDYTRRLAACNRSEMIVITYEIFFTYEADARTAFLENNYTEFKRQVHLADKVLQTLCGALDFKFELSGNLYSLYKYARKQLARSIYENGVDGLDEAVKIMQPLYTSFIKVAEEDHSMPIMSNTQKVFSGITYGRQMLNESMVSVDYNRGFLA